MTDQHHAPTINWRFLASNKKQIYHIQLPVAVLRVEVCDGVICQSEWLFSPAEPTVADTGLLNRLRELLQNPGVSCGLPLLRQGTAYRQRVWQAINRIPLGETMTYKTLAERLQSSPRAVANACRDNPFPGIIPCHRVVSVNGIGGFMGQSEGVYVELKRALLQYEQSIKAHYKSASC